VYLLFTCGILKYDCSNMGGGFAMGEGEVPNPTTIIQCGTKHVFIFLKCTLKESGNIDMGGDVRAFVPRTLLA
jgi:hypothetical protein